MTARPDNVEWQPSVTRRRDQVALNDSQELDDGRGQLALDKSVSLLHQNLKTSGIRTDDQMKTSSSDSLPFFLPAEKRGPCNIAKMF